MKKSVFVFFICAAAMFAGCGKKIHNTQEFNEYISDPANGFKVSRSVNNILISVIYTPPEYLALKEAGGNREMYDSILNVNKGSASFLMVLGPDEKKDNHDDIMYRDLKDFKGYVERSMTLNFDMENLVELHTENNSYKPVLSSLENTYGLSKDRKIDLVFLPLKDKQELEKADHFDFVYSDETYEVGILHFEFDKAALEKKLPSIDLQK